MKMTDVNDKKCSAGGDALAYVFDELTEEGRNRFESHLETCSECVDELAELSFSRYSVHEWKNIEFAPLATPRFVVPAEPARATLLDSLRAAFVWKGFAISGGLSVVLIAAIGFVLLQRSDNDTLAVEVENVNQGVGDIADRMRPIEGPSVVEPKAETQTAPAPGTVVKPRPTPGRRNSTAIETKQIRRTPQRTTTTAAVTDSERLRNSPTLGQYVEDRDESLRLSDLFDDLDTRERE